MPSAGLEEGREGRLCATLFSFACLRDAPGGVCCWLGIWRLWSPHSFPTPWFGNWVSVASSWPLRAVPGGEKLLLSWMLESVSPSPVPSRCHSLRLPLFPMPRSSPLLHPQGDKFCIHFLHLPILRRRRWFGYRLLLAWFLGGCYPGGQRFQLGLAPCCSFGDRLPKTWKVEGWKGWQEVMGRACC